MYFVVPHSSDQAVSGAAATFWLSLSGAETPIASVVVGRFPFAATTEPDALRG